jgi:hypothetical protein
MRTWPASARISRSTTWYGPLVLNNDLRSTHLPLRTPVSQRLYLRTSQAAMVVWSLYGGAPVLFEDFVVGQK